MQIRHALRRWMRTGAMAHGSPDTSYFVGTRIQDHRGASFGTRQTENPSRKPPSSEPSRTNSTASITVHPSLGLRQAYIVAPESGNSQWLLLTVACVPLPAALVPRTLKSGDSGSPTLMPDSWLETPET